MAFNPSSTIYLCNVAFDSDYKNQVYFANLTEQQNYFKNKVVKTFSNYLTVRKTLPDGSFVSSVKVDANIDTLHSLPCNYMYYQNANHGTKIFYAFITKLIYINEGTTEIEFETDVYQTWLFNVHLKPSYVVREHSKTDLIGDNIVPEKFAFNDYDLESAIVFNSLDKWGYLIASSECLEGSSRGKLQSGIFQGLFFYYAKNDDEVKQIIDNLEASGGDCVLSITVIPEFSITDNDSLEDSKMLNHSNEPASHTFEITKDIASLTFQGYKPKNKKLYTSPFLKMCVVNHSGGEAEYAIEDFYNNDGATTSARNFHFTMKGDISVNPSVLLYPHYYKGIADNVEQGVSISGFPQCSFNSDTFKLWLAKNQFGIAVDTAVNVGQIVAGVATAIATGGAGTALGVGGVVSGATGIASTINGVYQASKEPNKAKQGSSNNNLLTAMKKNKFGIYYKVIKKNFAQTVDDFFTMYGYQTNRVKTPNISSRPYYNYVQTIDVNIVGGIPAEDMKRLKQMYNSGVTLWKSTATIGDYSVNNAPQ